ncbi:hypothetical protein D9758_005815 [Tetrapyrgos nigripes]|uniref:Uncharacterized protein n=1 Tax=Tetrapyrgos nigripes TaxID=182062 RepID=A0A8H5GJM0_9AGAR|nr:hypothetical protein D9758_005815 [Tetrapyrgos nigripes]
MTPPTIAKMEKEVIFDPKVSKNSANPELENTIYQPSHGSSEKKICHPDKLRATVNENVEDISDCFIEITKAHKGSRNCQPSLTRLLKPSTENGHCDGRQEFSIPKNLVEDANRYYILAFCGVVFGDVLPGMVDERDGRWEKERKRMPGGLCDREPEERD